MAEAESRFTAGCDVGYSALKVAASVGGGELVFPLVYADAVDRPLADAEMERRLPQTSLLDVSVWRMGDEGDIESAPRYFFGDLAVREGFHPRYVWDKHRQYEGPARDALITALAYLGGSASTCRIVTGLPVYDLGFEQMRERYERTFPGTYRVRFYSGPLTGATRKVTVESVKVVAQGYGVFLDALLDNSGGFADPSLLRGTHLIIDGGFRTVNLVMVQDNLPVSAKSQSPELGMSLVHERVHRALAQHSGLDLGLERLERFIWNPDEIRNAELVQVIQEARESALAELARKLMAEMQRVWANELRTASSILVAGGGGKALAAHLRLPNVRVLPEPRMANARGFHKLALRQTTLRAGGLAGVRA